MNWQFDDNTPIYLQIMEQIKTRIVAGALKPGDKLPAVRTLALEAGVNPNTMQKALSELEREGLLCSKRTTGRFVSDEAIPMTQLKNTIAEKYMLSYLENMKSIGYDAQQALAQLQHFTSKE